MARRLRILADAASPPIRGVSYPGGDPIRFANGNDLRFEILAVQDGQVLSGVDLASVAVVLKDKGAAGDDPFYFEGSDVAPSATVTAENWIAGTDQTALIEIPGAETDIPAGSYLLIITAVTNTATSLTLGILSIAVDEDAAGDGTQVALPESYYTKRQADVKFAPIGLVQTVEDLAQSQAAGHIGYQTLAELEADLEHAANTLAEVTNDPDPDNNGTYIKLGDVGTGSWLKSTSDFAGRLSTLENEVPDMVEDAVREAGFFTNTPNREIRDQQGNLVLLAGETVTPGYIHPILSIREADHELFGRFGVRVIGNVRCPNNDFDFWLSDGVEAVPFVTPEDVPAGVEAYANVRLPNASNLGFADNEQRIFWVDDAGLVIPEEPEPIEVYVNVRLPEDATLAFADGEGVIFWTDMETPGGGGEPSEEISIYYPDKGQRHLMPEIKQVNEFGAVTFFNQEQALVLESGNLLVGYVDGSGQICVDHYDIVTEVITKSVVSSVTEIDDHNNPAFIRMTDGKIMAAFSRHGEDNMMRWRISLDAEPIDIDDWGAEQTLNTGAVHTYANLAYAGGDLYNVTRNGLASGGKWWVAKFNGTTFTDRRQMWNGPETDDNGYAHCTGDGDKLWILMATSDFDVDNSLICFYKEGEDWYAPDGTFIEDYEDSPLTFGDLTADCFVYTFDATALAPGETFDDHVPDGRVWPMDIKTKDGNVYVAFVVSNYQDTIGLPPINRKDYQRNLYFWAKWDGTSWTKKFIANGGWGISAESARYPGALALDPENPENVIISTSEKYPFALGSRYSSGELNSHFEIWYGRGHEGEWVWEPLTINSDFNLLSPNGSVGHHHPRIVTNGTDRWATFVSGYYEQFEGVYNTHISAIHLPPLTTYPT